MPYLYHDTNHPGLVRLPDMEGECFNCSGDASERYTLILGPARCLKDRVICDDCVSVFQKAEGVEVQEEPVLMRGGKSLSKESGFPHKTHELDELLKTLSNSIRREIIHYFEKHADATTASLTELVVHIERRTPSKTSEALWKTLYQTHLPRLEAREWLEFDTERKIVTYHGHDEGDRLLEEAKDVFST